MKREVENPKPGGQQVSVEYKGRGHPTSGGICATLSVLCVRTKLKPYHQNANDKPTIMAIPAFIDVLRHYSQSTYTYTSKVCYPWTNGECKLTKESKNKRKHTQLLVMYIFIGVRAQTHPNSCNEYILFQLEGRASEDTKTSSTAKA